MKFQYLGTAAAEGYPAVFCNCKYCEIARKRRGKNIRTRSQSIINDDLLIDLPADTYHHELVNKLEFDKIKYLLITHHHQDHFFPEELCMHGFWYANNLRSPKLKIVLSQDAYDFFKKKADGIHKEVLKDLEFIIAKPFEEIDLGDYKVIPLTARHMEGKAQALFYIIKDSEGKTILYAHDTGFFFQDVLDFIEKGKFVFDFVSYDCTQTNLVYSNEIGHMGFNNIDELRGILRKMGAINQKTIEYINHFSHNVNPEHKGLVKDAKKYGLKVSYDGLKIKI